MAEYWKIDGSHGCAARRKLDDWAHAKGKKTAAEGPFWRLALCGLRKRFRNRYGRERRSQTLEGSEEEKEKRRRRRRRNEVVVMESLDVKFPVEF